MNRNAQSVAEYLAALPADRRAALDAVRTVICANLSGGYEEGMQYGMIGYYVPHSIYPAGYHCDPKQPLPFAGLASQKNHMSLYLGCVYGNPEHAEWFRTAWKATGKKLDMGKACIRFKRLEDLPLDVIGEAVARVPVEKYLASYEANLPGSVKRAKPTKYAAANAKRVTNRGAAKQTSKTVRKTAAKRVRKKE
ncbi:MAG: DUF1801 domain-containing protein [Phycisphaerales bacterium]|nr:DUF1801 domain-containing protein [Phycisphaerales bacterium]